MFRGHWSGLASINMRSTFSQLLVDLDLRHEETCGVQLRCWSPALTWRLLARFSPAGYSVLK